MLEMHGGDSKLFSQLRGNGAGGGAMTVEEMKEAARLFTQSGTDTETRLGILNRIKDNTKQAESVLPALLHTLPKQEPEVQLSLLEVCMAAQDEGANIAALAETIADSLGSHDATLREKAASVLIKMGPLASGAAGKVLGCTRQKDEAIQVCAIRVLGAIGAGCPSIAAPRLKALMDDASNHSPIRDGAKQALIEIQRQIKSRELKKTDVLAKRAQAAQDAGATIDNAKTLLAGKRILVVEDQPPVRRVAVNILKKHGAEVHEARDGLDGFTQARGSVASAKPFDLILLDLNMPKMNGLEVISKMKKEDKLRDIPIYIMSACKDKKPIAVATKMGISGYILKPFEMKTFVATIAGFFAESTNA